MQVLSQCDSENDSGEHIIREVRKNQTYDKTPGM